MTAVTSPFNMETFQNTVHQCFSDSMGIQVIWANQSSPQPEYPFARLMITSGPRASSNSWNLLEETDLSRDGTEVAQTVWVPCSFTINCQVLVGGDDRRNPNMNAASYIVRARTAFQLPSYKTILWDENISFVSTEQTTNIPSMVADSQVSRVSMDTILSTTLSSTEYAGYIKTAEIQAPELGIDDVFGDI